MKYIAQQMHKTLVDISTGINSQVGTLSGSLVVESTSEGVDCVVDGRDFWINQLWSYLLQGIAIKDKASESQFFLRFQRNLH